MSEASGTLEQIALTISKVLEPLEHELAPGNARLILAELGIILTEPQEASIATPLQGSVSKISEVLTLTSELVAAIEAEDNSTILQKSISIITKIGAAIEGFVEVKTAIDGLGLGVPAAVINKIPERLFNVLLYRFLGLINGINQLLEFMGVLDRTVQNPGSSDPNNPTYTTTTYNFGVFGDWFSNPGAKLESLYGWGSGTFNGEEMLQKLEKLLLAIGAPAFYDDSVSPVRLDMTMFHLSPDLALNPKGLSLGVRAGFDTGAITLVEDEDYKISLSLGVDLPFEAAIKIQPDGNVTFIPPSPGGTASGEVEVVFEADRSHANEAFVLLGEAGGSRLEVGSLLAKLGLGLKIDTGTGEGEGTFEIGGEVKKGKVVIDLSNADGFIGDILGGLGLESDFDLGFGYSSVEGLYFYGSSTLIIQLPVHIELGPVEISALTISIGIEGNKFPVAIGANIAAKLGPLQAVVENIGVEANIELRGDRSGNMGAVDFSIGFKPPNGVGLSLDTGVVKGGGYLFFDYDRGEYAGALELTFSEIISLKAIGVITTKMPDGSDGFSLIIIITAEFGTPIQLGFGFTLLGVGGLVGLNRTMKLQPLAEGVRTGSVNNIMFPQDVVANAPRIISDLRTFFPPENGKFLIGPMAKLGWGTPTLISASLGIIIEIPGNIAILGVLKVALPTEEQALILLQINFIGAIEFDKERLWFFASLYDSRVLFITLEGEMGLLIGWGNDPSFVVSVGGFHPAFNPPPLPFPNPKRISINILNESWAMVRVQGYFAVTSNTVQFGARVEIRFDFSVIRIDGHIAFDALFQFSPFYFIISISASFSLKVFGIGLFSVRVKMSLEGPTPWRAKGTGKIKLLFFSVSANFDETWGESSNTTLPPVEVMPLMKAEYEKLENWKAEVPAGNSLLVSLRTIDATTDLVLHPVGTLHVSQRAIPLDLTLDKLGSQKPSDANKFTVTSGNATLSKKKNLKEKFPIAQYQEMEDANKLSRPSFEEENSGLELSVSGDDIETGTAVKRPIRYERIIIDGNYGRVLDRFITFLLALFVHFLKGNTVANSEASHKRKKELEPFEDKIKVRQNAYSVAFTKNNKSMNNSTMEFESEALAREFMNTELQANPNMTDELHVIPNHELNTAA